jgi:hypothetical protein
MVLSEKVPPSSPPSTSKDQTLEHLDYDFGGESTLPPPPDLTPEQEKKLWRKIDLRLMPILSLMYLFSFLDRGEHARFEVRRLLIWIGCQGNIGAWNGITFMVAVILTVCIKAMQNCSGSWNSFTSSGMSIILPLCACPLAATFFLEILTK